MSDDAAQTPIVENVALPHKYAKRMANLTPFKIGNKGGPGRPKCPQSRKEFRDLCRAQTPIAMQALMEIAQNPKQSPSARVSAANVLIENGWDKPKQRMRVDSTIRDETPRTESERKEARDSCLARIRQRI